VQSHRWRNPRIDIPRAACAIGFQTGHEMNWLPKAMHILREEMKSIEVTISSDYSPDLAEALVRGRLDVAFLRPEPTFDLEYEVVDHEPLIVLMPSDHPLTARAAIHPRELTGQIFIGGSNKAAMLHKVTQDFLRRAGLDIKLDHGVDNLAMAMSLVASTRGLAVGYNRANPSPILKLFLSRLGEIRTPAPAAVDATHQPAPAYFPNSR
jgi:LysR family transcriptional regulator, hca operon transcriptional activator